MKTIFSSPAIVLINVAVVIAVPAYFPRIVLTQPTAQLQPLSQNSTNPDTKKVPISIYKINVGIAPKTVIGESRRTMFGIVDQTWYTESLSNTKKFIDRGANALIKAGYFTTVSTITENSTESGSIFGNIANEVKTPSLPQSRFLVAGTITKAWMTARDDGWGGKSSDVDMKVNWELYDTLQNKVIFSKETYAVDNGGGITEEYYYTVLEKCAEKFFNSPEFKSAIEQSLRDFPAN